MRCNNAQAAAAPAVPTSRAIATRRSNRASVVKSRRRSMTAPCVSAGRLRAEPGAALAEDTLDMRRDTFEVGTDIVGMGCDVFISQCDIFGRRSAARQADAGESGQDG